MKILIVGLGYAGTRFLHAFQNVAAKGGTAVRFAYVGRTQRRTDLAYFSDVPSALDAFRPDIVILSVNDVNRADVGRHMVGYNGFVLCEKPFVCPAHDLPAMERNFIDASGFCLDLIERYSPISQQLRSFVQTEELELLRANFTWGKDRLGDHRPTCGVTSEVIHALDLVQHISGLHSPYNIVKAHGVCSDFSISGASVPDSISFLAKLGEIPVTGYASFVNVSRRREVGFILERRTGGLVFANMIFDDPAWDDDYLRIWESSGESERVLLEKNLHAEPAASGHLGLCKLIRLSEDVRGFVSQGTSPSVPFTTLSETVVLQRTLNALHEAAMSGPAMSFARRSPIPIVTQSDDWERLG